MKILVSGSTGLLGSALLPLLEADGHEVRRLVRRNASTVDALSWDPAVAKIDCAVLESFDAVVHLAGENIAGGRWSVARKKSIRDSRVQGTRLLCDTLASLDRPPQVLVCASAIGFYGHRGDEILDESSGPGTSFLCDVCREWEAATEPAGEAGMRVVNLRIGVVLSAAGGALAKMLLPFQCGLGGIVGTGRQYWSWIAIDDVIGAVHHVLTHDDLSGPINVVSPSPITNREFTKSLGTVLRRPTLFPMPAFVARLALGEMADELLLASSRVVPQKLKRCGFEFQFPELQDTLKHLLGR